MFSRRIVISKCRRVLLFAVAAATAWLALASAAIAAPGDINTIAGTGTADYTGDGGPATEAEFNFPWGLALNGGSLYLTDSANHAVRRINAAGNVSTVAGTGTNGFSGDGGPATEAELANIGAIAFDASGNMYIGDFGNNRIRKVDTSGTITTVAGTGTAGFSGDGGPATSAQLDQPRSLAFDGSGNMYIADSANNRVRRVSPGGTITTVAGTGTGGLSGDGGPATSAELNYPIGLAFDSAGSLYVADSANHRVRRVNSLGNISTFAGTGPGSTGDGGPATEAELQGPYWVTVDNSHNRVYISDYVDNRVRMVNGSGTIDTVAGTGAMAFSGDGGPAASAALNYPHGLAVDGSGNLEIADSGNQRIREVTESFPPQTTIDTGPTGTTNDPTPTFAFSSSEAGSSFECRVDAGAFAACSSPHTTAQLADGSHTFQVRATDPAGNVDSTAASQAFTVDSTPPQTTIDSGPTGTTNDPTPTFAFSSSEAGSSFECRVDAGTFAACSSPHTTAQLTDGSHTFQVRAIDGAGNPDPTADSRTFTVDTSTPQTTIDSGPSGATNDPTPTFAFSSSKAGSSFQCRVDAGTFAACSSPHTTAQLTNGSHTFQVRATDPLGNTDATGDSRTFTVDTVAPQTAIDSGPAGTTHDPTPTFAFSSSEAGSSFQCRVDAGSYSACASPRTVPHLADGSHTFEVRATDPGGNVDASASQRAFTVDSASVSVSGSTLKVKAAEAATDNLEITRASGNLRVTDLASGAYAGSGVHVGSGCTRDGDNAANCGAAGIKLIKVKAGDRGRQGDQLDGDRRRALRRVGGRRPARRLRQGHPDRGHRDRPAQGQGRERPAARAGRRLRRGDRLRQRPQRRGPPRLASQGPQLQGQGLRDEDARLSAPAAHPCTPEALGTLWRTQAINRPHRVHRLEAVDGTPIVDVKPVLSSEISER